MAGSFNSKVHFNETTSLDVDAGGQVMVAAYAAVTKGVLGSTAVSTDVATGTTFPNHGTVILNQVSPTTAIYARTYTVKPPIAGCRLDIIVCTTASTENVIDINMGATNSVGIQNAGTTSMPWLIASTDKSPSTYRSISLVGLSTSLWGVIAMLPSSTGWLFAATSS